MDREKDYEKIKDLGRMLHIPTTEMFWGFKVESLKDNDLIHEHEERGHSWVRNAYNAQVSQLCGVSGRDMFYGDSMVNMVAVNGDINYSGIATLMYDNVNTHCYMGQALSSDFGIVVGTSAMKYHFDQYKLTAQCIHGSGINQLLYQGTTRTTGFVGGSFNTIYTRSFVNMSGKNIIINEVGIYSSGNPITMAVRDVVATPITVPPDSKLTITYTISVPFPITASTNKTIQLLNFEENCHDVSGKQWIVKYESSARSTDKFKFGTASYYSPSGSYYMYYPMSKELSMAYNKQITYELNFYHIYENNSVMADSANYIRYMSISIYGNKMYYRFGTNASSWNIYEGAGNIAVAINSWHHIAVVKDDKTISVFVDGQLDKTFANIPDYILPSDDTCKFYLCSHYNNSGNGIYIDNFRVSNVARYTAPFTPPTEPFVLD